MNQSTTARSAFDLLSKPTLELTEDEIADICKDLRARRERFLAGQKDNQPKPKKETVAMTPEAKEQAAAEILGNIENLF